MAPGRFVTSSMEASSKLEFAAGRGFIRPRLGLGNLLVDVRLGLGNLLVDVEREGSDRRADTGPSPPRRCDFTEFVAGSRFMRRRIGFGDRRADAGPPPPRRCDSTAFVAGSRFMRRRIGLGDRHVDAGPTPPRCCDSTEFITGGRFIRRRVGLGDLVVESAAVGPCPLGCRDSTELVAARIRYIRRHLGNLFLEAVGRMKPPDEIIFSICLDHRLLSSSLPPRRLHGILSQGSAPPPDLRGVAGQYQLAALKRMKRILWRATPMASEFRASAKSHRVVEIHGEPPEQERIGLRVLLRKQSSSPPRRHQPLRASASHLQVLRRWCSNSHVPNVPPSSSSPPPPPSSPQPTNPADFWKINTPLNPSATKTEKSTIDETLLQLKFDPKEFARCNKLMETYNVLGQEWTFTKLKEQTKYLFDSLIVLVESFHEAGYCFSQISTSTVLVTSSWKFVLLEGCFSLNNWSVEGVKKDYRDTAVLFRKLLSESMGEETVHPPDFGMLLSLMEKDGFRNKYLIGTHVSLLPDDNISIAYMKIHEFILKMLLAEEKDKARQLKLRITRYSRISTRIRRRIPYKDIWLTKARSNSFMTAFLEQNERIMELGGTDFELLDTIRHFVCHRLDLLKLGFRYKANEVDRMWYAEFPTLLAELQLALFLVDRLEELELENFMNRKPMLCSWLIDLKNWNWRTL
uniref:Uncharacterized protein n=1 Tax=Oryza meridionalis TaxID=40149 RepID=A0A0E0CF72_9ORYZ